MGGNTDIGIGGGAFGAITRTGPGYDPYIWNLETALTVTFKEESGGHIQSPYQDAYVKLTVPRLFGKSLRLEVRPSYTTEATLGYYGLGDAAPPAADGTSSSFYEYKRTHPAVDTLLRFRVMDHFAGMVGIRYTYNQLTIASDSLLAEQQRSTDPEVAQLLREVPRHSVMLFQYGLQWDSRDSETSPHKGMFTEATVKLSPGGTAEFPYRYGQTNITSRLFVPLAGPRLVLATRIVGDLLFGNVPFYELPRFADTYALGGPNGVRGIPAQRYAGKVKVFGNLELRSEVAHFHALGKPLIFGLVGFFDAGRLWADTKSEPTLDGTGVGLKYGVGGGARIQSGDAFVLRVDIAWSPDARPIGAYATAGQAF